MSLSPATIRNVMADLTDSGLLFAPHTSAGRLPTDQGLRLFVDGLLHFGELTEEEREAITAALAASGRSLEDTLIEASSMLSGLSAAAGLVLAPKSEGPLRHIEFVPLGPGRALVVLVNAEGQVENRVIETPPGLPPSALQQASNYLNARLSGRPLGDLRRVVAEELAANRTELDALSSHVVAAGLAIWTDEGRSPGSLIIRGHARLLTDVTSDRAADRHPGAVRTAGSARNHAAPAGTGGAVGRGADFHRRRERRVRHIRRVGGGGPGAQRNRTDCRSNRRDRPDADQLRNIPGSTTRFMCSSVKRRAAGPTLNVTVLRSPGASVTRSNPRSSLTGRVTDATRSRT